MRKKLVAEEVITQMNKAFGSMTDHWKTCPAWRPENRQKVRMWEEITLRVNLVVGLISAVEDSLFMEGVDVKLVAEEVVTQMEEWLGGDYWMDLKSDAEWQMWERVWSSMERFDAVILLDDFAEDLR